MQMAEGMLARSTGAAPLIPMPIVTEDTRWLSLMVQDSIPYGHVNSKSLMNVGNYATPPTGLIH